MRDLKMRLKHAVSDKLANIRIPGASRPFTAEEIDRLNQDGIFQINGFLDPAICQSIVRRFASLESDQPQLVVHDSNGSDARIYGADRVDDIFALEQETSALDALAHIFYRSRDVEKFQVAGHIRYTPDNLGSGSGWHRDSPFSHQFKFIIYLDDVTADNGPFQYIPGSHRKDVIARLSRHLGSPLSQYRFSQEEISALQAADVLPPPQTVTGPAGTLLVANVKGLHRGAPLLSGERWAVTRYYYKGRVPSDMERLLAARPI